MRDKKRRNPYKYDFRFSDALTETKDLKKFIKINIIILVGFFVLFVAGLICGLVLFQPDGKVDFIVLMIFCSLLEILPCTLCTRAIIRAAKKIKKNESEMKR